MATNAAPIIIKRKKKGGHGDGHHGGAWKVAYADFVTAMMAFFLVMWLLGMSQEVKDLIPAARVANLQEAFGDHPLDLLDAFLQARLGEPSLDELPRPSCLGIHNHAIDAIRLGHQLIHECITEEWIRIGHPDTNDTRGLYHHSGTFT